MGRPRPPQEFSTTDPLADLAKLLPRRPYHRDPRLPVFTGGLVGYAGYDTIRYYEGEKLTAAWHAIAFRTKAPPNLKYVGLVEARHVIAGTRVVVTASSTDALSVDAHAIVQAGAECGL